MARTSRFSQEVRERAVRMVFEHGSEYGSEWEAIGSIAEKIGCSAETLRKWVRQTEVDSVGATDYAGLNLFRRLDPVAAHGRQELETLARSRDT